MQEQDSPVVIVTYHRVADTEPVEWSLTNREFESHVNRLSQQFEFVSLEEAQHRILNGNPRPAVHLTFDNGYAENCGSALPLLLDRQIPCTFFVALENVTSGKPFTRDRLAGHDFPVISIKQLRNLADRGVEIASQGRSLSNLGTVRSLDRLYDEVVSSRRELADWLGRPVRYFAFPIGSRASLNHAAAAMAREDGCEGVLSGYGGFNLRADDCFHLQRCHAEHTFGWIDGVSTDSHQRVPKAVTLRTFGPDVATAIEFCRRRSTVTPISLTPTPCFEDAAAAS